MGQTIEELLGVGTRISPRINEDFPLIKFTLNEVYTIVIIVDRRWDFEFTLSRQQVRIKEDRVYKKHYLNVSD